MFHPNKAATGRGANFFKCTIITIYIFYFVWLARQITQICLPQIPQRSNTPACNLEQNSRL